MRRAVSEIWKTGVHVPRAVAHAQSHHHRRSQSFEVGGGGSKCKTSVIGFGPLFLGGGSLNSQLKISKKKEEERSRLGGPIPGLKDPKCKKMQLHGGLTKLGNSFNNFYNSFFVIVRPKNVRRNVGACKTWEQILQTYPHFSLARKSPWIRIDLAGCPIGGWEASCPACHRPGGLGGKDPALSKPAGVDNLRILIFQNIFFLNTYNFFCIFQHFQHKVAKIRGETKFWDRRVWVAMNPSPSIKTSWRRHWHGRRKRGGRGTRPPQSKNQRGTSPRNDISAPFFLTLMKILHFPPFSK